METAVFKRVGMLTPSSNTVLEPYTNQIFMPFNTSASVHFSRFKVTEISLSSNSLQQFNHDTILEAAHRLAEAKVDCIAWNGTSAAWLGMEQDDVLCSRITTETGIAATSTMAAFAEILGRMQAKRLAIVTPYKSEIQEKIIKRYYDSGFSVVYEKHLEDPGNFSFADYSATHIQQLAMQAAALKPDAILIVCTNFRGAPIAEVIEEMTGVPVLDSVAVTAWKTLRMTGLDNTLVKGWGQLFTIA